MEVLLDESQLKEEISFLRKTWRTKQKLASIMANKGVAVTRMKARQAFEHPSQKVTLLLDWVNAVSEFYNLKVSHIKEIVCSCIYCYVVPNPYFVRYCREISWIHLYDNLQMILLWKISLHSFCRLKTSRCHSQMVVSCATSFIITILVIFLQRRYNREQRRP